MPCMKIALATGQSAAEWVGGYTGVVRLKYAAVCDFHCEPNVPLILVNHKLKYH